MINKLKCKKGFLFIDLLASIMMISLVSLTIIQIYRTLLLFSTTAELDSAVVARGNYLLANIKDKYADYVYSSFNYCDSDFKCIVLIDEENNQIKIEFLEDASSDYHLIITSNDKILALNTRNNAYTISSPKIIESCEGCLHQKRRTVEISFFLSTSVEDKREFFTTLLTY